jgi:SAM-dependent methyltransferase
MATSTAVKNEQPGQIDLSALKTKQHGAWSSGDYAVVGTTLQIVGEELCEALDLRAGQKVLDVAAGNGNASFPAAEAGADVVASDLSPDLLAAGRAHDPAGRITWTEADAEALPFDDASFDAVLSVYGSMFAPDQRQAAAEILRVTRPGGTVALASWVPEGFLGAMFRTVAAHVPPPAGAPSAMAWGTERHLLDLFGQDVTWTHRRPTFTFRFVSAEAMIETFVRYYGPTLRAVEAAGSDLATALTELVLEWNRLPRPGPVAVPGTYLESVGVRS